MNTVVPESSIDAMSRPGLHLDDAGRVHGCRVELGREHLVDAVLQRSVRLPRRTAVAGSSSFAPDASTRMRCRRSSAAFAPR